MVFIKNKVVNRKGIIAFFILVVISSQLSAQQISQNDFFDLSLEELMQVDVTIATKTPVKVNDVPGVVSIINHEELAYRGFDTVWESLASLPGMQISYDSTGSKLLVVRGVGKTFASGKVKLLLNGVALNSTLNATAEVLMNLPVQQVQKIEFIRGPGSAVHGEYSYAGVINVITKKEGNGIYTVLASNNTTRVGGHYIWKDVNSDLKIAMSLSSSQTDGADIESGLDSGNLFAVPGYSSGLVNTKREMNNVLINMDYQNSHTSLQWLQAKRGDHFGINDYLPPDERESRITDESLAFHSDVDVKLNPTLKLNVGLNVVESKTDKKNQFVGSPLVFGALLSDPDVVSNGSSAETRIEININLISTDYDNHVLFAELSSVKVNVDKSEQFLNLDPNTFLPTAQFFSWPSPTTADQERDILSLTLQDEFTINPNLILTTGVRYDQYDEDIGSSTTPRLALVYHATDEHSFRTQYAEAFRPPTFLEANGAFSDAISPETIKTLEFGHQYQQGNSLVSSVLFISHLNNLITFVNSAPFGFSNTDEASLLGLEFEFEESFDDHWKVKSNLSLLKTEDKSTGEEIYGSSNVLANAQIDYIMTSLVGIKTSFNYVGKRHREESDTRGDLDDYLLTNVSMSIKKLGGVSGLSFHVGINNLLNQDVDFQSGVDTYVTDYPVSDSRSFWLQVDYAI